MSKFLVCCLFVFPLIESVAQPKASLEQDSIRFGVVYAGEVRTAKIILRNIGNKPLEIVQVQPSCGCTTTKQPSGAIAPGTSDVIEVTYSSAGFRGEIHKQVYVTTNDPTVGTMVVNMTGIIKEEMEPVNQSGELWLSTVPLGTSVDQTISWRNVTNGPITIRDVTTASKQLEVKWDRKIVPPNEVYVVHVRLTPTKANFQRESFTLETDSPRQKYVLMKLSFIGQQDGKP